MKPSDEGDHRLPVWTALSELFLDTELSERDIARIAGVLSASPYDARTLEDILVDEVLPAFGANLLSVAGEWTSWSESDVARIMAQASAKGGAAKRMVRLAVLPIKTSVLGEWRRVEAVLQKR